MKIILDAMGGDHAPKAPVLGALAADKNYEIVLVGDSDAIWEILKEQGHTSLPENISVVHTTEVVDMHDDPANVVRQKKNSSMMVALKMLSDGDGDACISAGSTGALLSGATLIVKRVKGIRRAAMGPAMPNKAGGKTILLDCGANAECTPEFLLQFGLVGSLFAKKQLGVENPRVGLLNIGTEDSKGTPLQKEAHALLTDAHNKGLINFIGNIEGRDALLGGVDVVVCDGFSGNVLLKSIEGTAMYMGSLMKHKIFKRKSKLFGYNPLSLIGYLLCKPGVSEVLKLMDYREIGGTQFLGIKKPVIKAHGSSDELAFRNAIRQAADAAARDFTTELSEDLALLEAAE